MDKRIFSEICGLLQVKPTVIIAIDGDCASGKTTLAAQLSECFSANVFHTDDFYLPFHERNKDFYNLPDGNTDYKRLENEVLKPLTAVKGFSYRKYNAHNDTFSQPIEILPKQLNIIEGSYSMHPKISKFYDFSIFIEVSQKLQEKRIENRNPQAKDSFFSKWIPMEKMYSKTYNIPQKCNIKIYGG